LATTLTTWQTAFVFNHAESRRQIFKVAGTTSNNALKTATGQLLLFTTTNWGKHFWISASSHITATKE
jgi:hypothetical protein